MPRENARALAAELRDARLPDTEIARRLGVSRQTVRRWLGPRMRRATKRARLEDAVQRLEQGRQIGAVAEEFAVSRSALREHAAAAGLPERTAARAQARLEEARRLRLQGWSDRAIAQHLALSRLTLASALGHRSAAEVAHDRRRVRIATCLTLYQGGMTQAEVAEALGVSVATVQRTLAAARAEGLHVRPRLKAVLPHYRRLWSTHDLVKKAREWARLYDRPPTSSEWNPWHPAHRRNPALGVDRIVRFYTGEWPFTDSIVSAKHRRPWGTSWNAYLRTAGFQPLPHGYHYVADDDGRAVHIDGRRLIHSNDHSREYLEGEPLGRRP